MPKLVYSNHREEGDAGLPVLDALREVAESAPFNFTFGPLKECSPKQRLAELQSASVAVLHGDIFVENENAVTSVVNRAWLSDDSNATGNELVVVLISSSSFSFPPKAIEFAGGRRYVLGVRDTIRSCLAVRDGVQKSDTLDAWRQLLTAIGDRELLEQWLERQDESTSPVLFRFFGEPRSTEVLAALAILCQGFLAVYAAYFGEAKPWATDDNLLRALRKMGYVSEDSIDVRSEVENLRILKHLNGVSNQTYWLGVFGEFSDGQAVQGTCGRVRSAVETEWGKKDGEWFAKFSSSFDALVERLEGLANAETPFDPDASAVVAEMYCAIAARLEGQA